MDSEIQGSRICLIRFICLIGSIGWLKPNQLNKLNQSNPYNVGADSNLPPTEHLKPQFLTSAICLLTSDF
jgi:hypothetical protein